MLTKASFLYRAFCAAAVCVFLTSTASADHYGYGLGGADYQYAWARAGVPEAADEMEASVLATADVASWFVWIPDYEQIEAHAQGEILADGMGRNKAWCRVNHRDTTNEFGGGLECTACAETFTPFTFTSSSLNPGEVISVSLDVVIDGFLLANEGGDLLGMETEASVEVLIAVIRKSDDSPIVEVDGEVSWLSGYGSSGEYYTLDAIDALENACTVLDDVCSVDYQDTLMFDVVIGEEYWFFFDLATGAGSTGWPDSYEGPLETLAIADFYNTSSYELTTSADATFVVLPEPGAMLLLVAGGLVAMRRRR